MFQLHSPSFHVVLCFNLLHNNHTTWNFVLILDNFKNSANIKLFSIFPQHPTYVGSSVISKRQNISVSEMIGYVVNDRGSILVWGRNFSLRSRFQTSSGFLPTSYPTGTQELVYLTFTFTLISSPIVTTHKWVFLMHCPDRNSGMSLYLWHYKCFLYLKTDEELSGCVLVCWMKLF